MTQFQHASSCHIREGGLYLSAPSSPTIIQLHMPELLFVSRLFVSLLKKVRKTNSFF